MPWGCNKVVDRNDGWRYTMNIRFKNGEIHKVDIKESFKSLKGIKLKCGLVANGIISTKHVWYFTFKKATCRHCLKKAGTPAPTDLSNYHSFIK